MSGRRRAPVGRPGRDPALDGLRALAIGLVLIFHHDARWLPGGWLGVSTFFTLSGFLIARSLLAELDGGGIALGRFYVRRARRLLPAAYVTVAAVAAVWWATGRPLAAGEALASLLYAQNWYLAGVDRSYAELFAEASPLHHLWSLAIEEQFYVVFPAVLALAAGRARRRARAACVLGVLVVASFAAAGVAGPDAGYYGLHTRAGELLAGAVLAASLGTAGGVRFSRWLRRAPVLPIAAGIGLVGLASTTSLEQPWSMPWATAANAALAVVVIGGVVAGGPVARWFATRPAAYVGRLSYSLYLVHWPAFVLLDADTVGVEGPALLAVRVAVSAILAVALHVAVERPIHLDLRIPTPAVNGALAGVAAVAVAVASATAPTAPGLFDEGVVAGNNRTLLAAPRTSTVATAVEGIDADERAPAGTASAAETGEAPGTVDGAEAAEAAHGPAAAPEPSADVPRPLRRVLFVGDSTAWGIWQGMPPWGEARGVEVRSFIGLGCGLGGSTPTYHLGDQLPGKPECDTWLADVAAVVDAYDPDVVVVVCCLADLADREVDGRWARLGDARFDQWMAGRLDRFAGTITARGASVAWATMPAVDPHYAPGADVGGAINEGDPTRVARYNELIEGLAVRHAGVAILDWPGFLDRRPGGSFAPGLRDDGVHVDSRNHPDVVDFFGRAILGLATPSSSVPAG